MGDPSEIPAERRGAGRWTKVLLAVSLGINLLIGGLAVGAFLRDGPPRGGRDFGLGPLAEALSHADRKVLRDAFVERHPDLRADRRAARAELQTLLATLRADPFDPAALDAALLVVAQRNTALLDSGRALVADRLKTMDAAARAEFADRLEKGLRRFGRKDDKDDKDN